jgi:pyridoxal phosphate enzyme (YggS family)
MRSGRPMNRDRLRENLATVLDRIAAAARRSGREAAAVRLVAVTKKCPAEWARELAALGQLDLGENYPQELWAKADALADLPVRWHLIGHLQGNKARRTAARVRMIHGVDSWKLLRALDELAPALPDPPRVCLQVNVSAEPSKHGWTPEGLLADAEAIAACRAVPVVGLMTMAALGTDAETARPAFVRLRAIRDELRRRTGLALDELSMGMSNDFEAAVEEGATLVRVGSALFEGVAP